MRDTFIKTLVELAQRDERIVLLTGDLGYLVIEEFQERFPERFINVGVAEQNMIGIATGLAEAGLLPFCYSITTFATLRPFEFIRNGPVLHQLPVRIVGVGGGYEYGSAGHTHHGIDDIGVMRTQNGLTVLAPADFQQTKTALSQTWDSPNPIYYRLGKNDRDTVKGLNGDFELGRLQCIQPYPDHADVLLIAMGGVGLNLAEAVERLAKENISAASAVLASISPAPVEDLLQLLPRYKLVVTAEAHVISGGIGSLVSELIAENSIHTRLIRNAIRRVPEGQSGSNNAMNRLHYLDAEGIAHTVLQALRD